MISAIQIRELNTDDWLLYKSIRLNALVDSPEAFGCTFDNEAGLPDTKWKDRIRDSSVFVAFIDDEPTGLVVSFTKPENPSERLLFSMWVEDKYRNLKIGTSLVQHFIEWAKSENATKIIAGYSDENEDVFRFYEQLGFKKTGEKKPLTRSAQACEHVIDLDI